MLHNEGLHYKMYKAKKHWLFAGMGVILTSSALLMGGSVVAHADGTSTTAVADVPADTPTDGTGTADSTTSTAKADSPALDAYNDYKDHEYTVAKNQLDTAKTQANTDQAQFENDKNDYQDKLNQYQTDVNTKAPNYQTSDQSTKNSLDDKYQSVKNDYDNLTDQKSKINTEVTDANSAAKSAQDQLDALYDALPDNVKNAGKKIGDYNATTLDVAKQLVTGSTAAAYAAALKAQSNGIVNTVNSVSDLYQKVTADKLLVPSSTDENGVLGADLYGKIYTDQNGDHQITYEDDILPVALANLKSDTEKVAQNQTDLKGSYADVVALFNYMKQVADTALPYSADDGTVGRVQSANANDTSYSLMYNGSPMASGFGSVYATQLLNSIEATKAQMENQIKTIDDETGNTFDEVAFNQAFDQNLKDQAIAIYNSQTEEILKIANNLLTAFKAADDSGDELWATSPSAGIKTNTLTATLETAINNATQQIDAGKVALSKLAPSDHFLTIAYSTGDSANGFTQTINKVWGDLYGTMDKFGMSMSPLLKFDVASADKDAQKDDAGNEIYSAQFIKDHAAVFNAATTLADSITKLMQQSSVITNDYVRVLNTLLTISDNYPLVKPEMAYVTPLGDKDTITPPQQVDLVSASILVHLKYVDDDENGAPVTDGAKTLFGHDGDTVTWTATVPAHYQIVGDASGSLKIGSGTDATVTIHLTHQHVTSSVTQTVTTQFVPGTDDVEDSKLPADDVQTITWTVDHDLVTGDWTATPNKKLLNPVKAPVIPVADGYYAPDISTYAGVALAPKKGTDYPANGISADSTQITRTITYHKEKAEVGPGIAVGFKEQVPDTAPSTTLNDAQGGQPGDPTVITPNGGDPTVVPDGDNGNQPAPADDNSTTTDAGGDSTTGPDSQTTETGRSASEGQATGNSQSVSGGTAVRNNNGSVTTVQANSQQESPAQGQLPQTNETDENAAAGLGVLGLSLLMGALGLKKRKRD